MTDPVSISEKILSTLENSLPVKLSTTISTIVVQSAETRVVVALLKSGKSLTFRILELNPNLTSLGCDINESEQMLNDHETVIAKLEEKQTPVDDLLRQVNALDSIENPDVYVAMAVSLSEAWTDLNSKLGTRKDILTLCHNLHSYRQECLDSFRKCDNSTRKETLRIYSKAVDTGGLLQDKLRTLEDSWESIVRVNYWLDDLRHAMLEWKAELSRKESKEKEAKAFQEYLDELNRIKERNEEYSVTRTELLSMFRRIEAEYRLTSPLKQYLELKVYELLKSITDKIEVLENVKIFLEENNKLGARNFTQDYSEKLELVKDLDQDLSSKIKKRLDIQQEYENILSTCGANELLDEKLVVEKLSQDETLDITSALEDIRRKHHRDQIGVYELFKERIAVIEASIKEGGELQDYILLNDMVNEIETDAKNAKDFNKKDELLQKCKNLASIVQHRISILEDVKKFINENTDLSDDSFRAEHVKTLRRLTDSKDGRILSCILRNRLTVRNVYELILKSPLDYEEEEIVDLISVDQTLETDPALEKIMARRRLLELIKTLDFPLPENLATAKSDLVDFKSFENMVEALPNAPEELVEKTNAKKDKILKCIQFYELLEQTDKPVEIEILAALETELFGTSHWNDLIPNKNIEDKAADTIDQMLLESEALIKSEMLRVRNSRSVSTGTNDSSSRSVVTSIEVLHGSEDELIAEIDAEDDRISTATPSLNLSEVELYSHGENEIEEIYATPTSNLFNDEEIEIKSAEELLETLAREKEKLSQKNTLGKPLTEIAKVREVVHFETFERLITEPENVKNKVDGEEPIAIIRIVSKSQDGGNKPSTQSQNLGSIELETIYSKDISDSESVTSTEILKPIQQTRLEVEVLQITETPVELQNIGMETQIVQEPIEVQNVGTIIVELKENPVNEESNTQIIEVPQELTNIGMETQLVEEHYEIGNFVISETPKSADEENTKSQTQDNPNVKGNIELSVIQGRMDLGVKIIEEPLELKNIGKQTVIIEEPVDFELNEIEEIHNENITVRVRILSDDNIDTISEPESVTSIKTITQSKTPQELENDKVEEMLLKLQELKNPEELSPIIEEDDSVFLPRNTAAIDAFDTTKPDTARYSADFSEKFGPEEEEQFLDKIEEELPEEYKLPRTSKSESQPPENLKENVNESKSHQEAANLQILLKTKNVDDKSLSPTRELPPGMESECTIIPVELITTTTDKIHPVENQQNKFNTLDEIKSTKKDQIPVQPCEHYVNDITVETETLQIENALVFTIENKSKTPPKKQNTVETQTNDDRFEKHRKPESDLESLDKLSTETDRPVFENYLESFGSENFEPVSSLEGVFIETQIQTTKPSVEFPRRADTPESLSKSPKPSPNVRPPGLSLSSLPRKSAFAEVQTSRSPSIESQSALLIDKIYDKSNQTSPSIDQGKVDFSNPPDYETQPAVTVMSPQSQPASITNEFATGFAKNILNEVRRQLKETKLIGICRTSISTQTSPEFEINHPDGLLQIMEAENDLNTVRRNKIGEVKQYHSIETGTEPDYELLRLEGYKSPVQEVQTQTLDPPPVLNSETQTYETLRRQDSTYTQTVSEETKTFNIQTQTSFDNLRRQLNSEEPKKLVGTEVNYFPNVFHEILCREKSPVEHKLLENIDNNFCCGASEKSQHFEKNSYAVPTYERISQTEIFIPISLSPNPYQPPSAKMPGKETPILRPVPKIASNSQPEPAVLTRIVEIKIPSPESILQQKSPQVSPYSNFTNNSSPLDMGSPYSYEYRTPTPGTTRVIPIQVSNQKNSQETGNRPLSPKTRVVSGNIQQVETVSPIHHPAPAHPSSPSTSVPPIQYPWRVTPPDGLVNSEPPTTSKSGTLSYTFGHFEETKETIPPEKQPSVRDRVKYWEPRTSISGESGPQSATSQTVVMDTKPETEDKPRQIDFQTNNETRHTSARPEPYTTPKPEVNKFRRMFQDPTNGTDLTEESVAHAIEERRKELAEYQQQGTVSIYRKLFQSFEQTTSSESASTKEKDGRPFGNTKSFFTETFQKSFNKPQEETDAPKSTSKATPASKEPIIQRRHSETISTSKELPKSEEIPQEGTVARFRRLFQNYNDNSSNSNIKESFFKLSEERTTSRQGIRNELVTSPPGFRTYERFISPAFPKTEFVQEESVSHRRNCSGEWMTEKKVYRSSGGETIDSAGPLSPILRPTKFVRGEFHQSDYESDYECKIPPVWFPPSHGEPPPSSFEFRSITPILSPTPMYQHHSHPSDNEQMQKPSANSIPPIKTSYQYQQQPLKPERFQNFRSEETQFIIKPKPIPPPKPTTQSQSQAASTLKETLLTSKVTKTEETKFMLRPIKSPQPFDSSDDLNVRRSVYSPTSPPSALGDWKQNQPPKTTTQIYKTEELISKQTE